MALLHLFIIPLLSTILARPCLQFLPPPCKTGLQSSGPVAPVVVKIHFFHPRPSFGTTGPKVSFDTEKGSAGVQKVARSPVLRGASTVFQARLCTIDPAESGFVGVLAIQKTSAERIAFLVLGHKK